MKDMKPGSTETSCAACFCWMAAEGSAATPLTDGDLGEEEGESSSPCMTWEMPSGAARGRKENPRRVVIELLRRKRRSAGEEQQ